MELVVMLTTCLPKALLCSMSKSRNALRHLKNRIQCLLLRVAVRELAR